MKVASFFSGIGGFELGLARAGHQTIWACEIDPFARRVYEERFGAQPQTTDVRAVRAAEIPEADLWCGGFPCQDLSVAGRRTGFQGDRSGLVWTLLDLASERKPEWILLENVPGMLTADKRRGFGRLLARLDQLGYVGCWRGVDAQFFLVPQRRRRIFILARRAGGRPDPAAVLLDAESGAGDLAARQEAKPYAASRTTRGFGLDSVAHAVTTRAGDRLSADDDYVVLRAQASTLTGGDPKGRAGRRYADDDNLIALGAFNSTAESGRGGNGFAVAASPPIRSNSHGAPAVVLAINSRDEVRLAARAGCVAARPGGMKQAQWIAYHVHAAASCAKERHAFESEHARSIDTTGGFATNQGGTLVRHGYLVRRFTPLECERLQGFPDFWTLILNASDAQRYRAIGNAVAVACIEWIGRRLNAAIKRHT